MLRGITLGMLVRVPEQLNVILNNCRHSFSKLNCRWPYERYQLIYRVFRYITAAEAYPDACI